MNTFNKKSLCVALAATGMLGAAGVAQAVNVAESGLGNVLIYPYYTVNKDVNGNSFNTLMSVVNTTASTKVVKVRFREGKNSAEVLDFNVFLSPFDVWTASIVPGPTINPNPDNLVGPALIATSDNSCTIPSNTQLKAGVSFRTLQLEAGDNGASRTTEGYFEVFEMATYAPDSIIAINTKHGATSIPLNCASATDNVATLEAQPPGGGLFGNMVILSPAGGGAFSQSATALANFTTTATYQDTGSTAPTLNNADPLSNMIAGGQLFQTDWTGSGGAGEGNNAAKIKRCRSEVDRVIRQPGQPGRQPDPKKPTHRVRVGGTRSAPVAKRRVSRGLEQFNNRQARRLDTADRA
jgi:hypothetical protein